MGLLSEPAEGWGKRWKQERQLSGPRTRRAAYLSLAVHLLVFVTIAIGIPSRPQPPARRVGIPITLIGLPGRAAGGGTGGGVRPLAPPPVTPPKKPAQQPPQEQKKPAEKKPPAPTPQTEPKTTQAQKETVPKPAKEGIPTPTRKKAEPQGGIASSGNARPDSTAVLRSEVPLAGGGSGALEMSVDGPITEYSYYLAAVRDKISAYWEPPPNLSRGGVVSAVVNFRIDRRGNVATSYVEEPSGASLFDQAGLRAIAQANPLPPLPDNYGGDWLGIHLRFVYTE